MNWIPMIVLTGTLVAWNSAMGVSNTWYVAPEGDDAAAGTSWEAPLKTIGNAVAKAADADEIVVSNGVYSVSEPINISKILTLRAWSSNPRDTLIDGGGVTNCVSITATNVWFSGFTVTNALGPEGAGIRATCNYNKNARITLSNCVVTCCTSGKKGGGIEIEVNPSVEDDIEVIVTDCEISHNVNNAEGDWHGGGGIYQGQIGALTIRNCRVFGNRCPEGRGGGIYTMYGDVRDCEVYDNSARVGGGICMQHNGIGTVHGCRIYNNTSTEIGGGIVCGKPEMTFITDCVVSNNNAKNGGGIGSIPGEVRITVSNSLIVANQATNGYGGGVYHSGSRITRVTHSIIRGNSATSAGGGFYYHGGWVGTNESFVLNCLFESNWVKNDWINGGAIFTCGGSNLLISACTVVTNSSLRGYGGGIYLEKPLELGRPKIRNTIFSGNMSGKNNLTANVYATDAADTNDFSYCFEPNGRLPPDQGNVSGDPKLENFEEGDYRLKWGSPCRNAGDYDPWMAGAVDLHGSRRICGPRVDIGAYELFYLSGMVLEVK